MMWRVLFVPCPSLDDPTHDRRDPDLQPLGFPLNGLVGTNRYRDARYSLGLFPDREHGSAATFLLVMPGAESSCNNVAITLRADALHDYALAKSAIIWGPAESRPTMSSIPESFGSAIVKPLEVSPTTISRAGIPILSRYSFRA